MDNFRDMYESSFSQASSTGRFRSTHTEHMLGDGGIINPCPFCHSTDVLIVMARNVCVECCSCHAEGPIIRITDRCHSHYAISEAIRLWRGNRKSPPMRMTKAAIKDYEKKAVIDMRLIEIMDIVNAEWTSDPNSTSCFDLRIVLEANALLEERQKLGLFV